MTYAACIRAARGLTLALSGWILAGCATDRVTAPLDAPPPQAVAQKTPDSAKDLVKVGGRLGSLKVSLRARAEIGPAGGVLALPAAGFELIVPPGAVATKTEFSVKAEAGNALAYEFEPHGATFSVPLRFRQNVAVTSVPWGAAVRGGYFSDPTDVDLLGKKALVSECLDARWDGTWIEFDVWHFSGYLVSMA